MSSFQQPPSPDDREPQRHGTPAPSYPVAAARFSPPLDQPGAARIGFADQLSIDTPEQVALTFPIAGIGSRFVALLLDHLFLTALYLALGLTAFLVIVAGGSRHWMDSLAGKWFLAGVLFLAFLLLWGYFALFEALWHGQTPGKRIMKLRVIKDAGRQITLFESLARNLLRVVDYLPSFYLAGVITMLANKRNKRLGDLAAGTIVIHERAGTQPLLFEHTARAFPSPAQPFPTPSTLGVAPSPDSIFPADALARLGPRDLVVLEAFFARALDLPLEMRAAMAYRIVGELAARMGVPVPEGNPERAMEAMAIGLRRPSHRF